MSILGTVSPVLRLMFERVGKPEVLDRPLVLGPSGGGAVIVCNHVGWADSLWMAYAVYPRELRNMSKQELFASPLTSWVLKTCRSIAIDRGDPAPSSIKSAVESVRNGDLLLIFPSGSRSLDVFKRGAATIALHAGVPIVPALYQGPKQMMASHVVDRPVIKIHFGPAISTTGLAAGKASAVALTEQLRESVELLRSSARAREAETRAIPLSH